jgi:SAM-dependent methyltransferase
VSTSQSGGATAWRDNLGEELDFWRRSLADPGPQGDIHRERAQVRPVSGEMRSRVPDDADPVRLLDVGSGPLTTIGIEWPGRNVEAVAVDPLADEYNAILREVGIEPPVPATAVMAEELGRLFEPGSFHIVHVSNALDHTSDAVEAIRQMARVTTAGGSIMLLHHVEVGVMEGYQGLHQWNLTPLDADVRVWSREREALLSDLVPGADISVEMLPDDVFCCWVRLPDEG